MNTLKGFRTFIFNAVMGLLLVLRGIYPEAELPDGAAIETAIGLVFSSLEAITIIGNLLLRAITTTPIFKKEADA